MAREEPEVEQFIKNCLSDTGYLCRNLLGWDYDEGENQEKLNVGTGGVRADGSHQAMVDLLDNDDLKFKLIEAPRGSYKSTILQGYCVRKMLLYPDIRIMYVARSDDMAVDKSQAMREAMMSEPVTRFFGEQRGTPWDIGGWTVRGRKQKNLQTPTFRVFSQDSMPTGGRANIVILDDFIDDKNCTNPEQIEKSKRNYKHIAPFVAKGGTLIVVGTRWAEEDLYADLEENPLFKPPHGGQLILGAGVRVVRTEAGHFDLEEAPGGITFPHLSMDMLRQKLHQMSGKGEYYTFSCQYLNEVPSGMGSIFRRWMFQPLPWETDMEKLTGYLLTDTATSQKDEGCHSVVAYVGFDAADHLYLLDLRVGHWEPHEFVNVFFDVLEQWQGKVNHAGEVWEDISLSTVFNYALESDSRARKTRLRTISIKRYAAERKHQRIQRMHTPMYQKRFFVVNTVPRTFDDVDGVKELWNPEGFYDARTRTKQPSGELVDQFIKLGSHPKNDVADTIAMSLEYDKKRGSLKRYCQYRPYRAKSASPLTVERKTAYHKRHYSPQSQDWWDQVTNDLYGQF